MVVTLVLIPLHRRRLGRRLQEAHDPRGDLLAFLLLQEVPCAGRRSRPGRRPECVRPCARGRGGVKIGSESEKRTSVGALPALERRRGPRASSPRSGGRARSARARGRRARPLSTRASGTARCSREDRVVDLGHGRDPDELAGDELGSDAPHELAEAQPLGRRRAPGADAGVQDDEPSDAIGPLDGEPEPDRAAPVLDDDGRLAEIELVGEALDRASSGSRTSSPRSASACPSVRIRSSRVRRRARPPASGGIIVR